MSAVTTNDRQLAGQRRAGAQSSGARSRRLTRILTTVGTKIARAALVVLLVSFLVVLLLSLVPGSVASVILGDSATPEAVAALEAELGVHDPFFVRYLTWLGDAVTGDLGTSAITGEPVTAAITSRLAVTLEIAVLGLLLALVVSVFLGVLAASFRDTWVDKIISALVMGFLSFPAFVAAPVLVLVFAITLGWFPVGGWVPVEEGLGDNLRSIALPVVAVALAEVAAFQRLLRADLIATLGEDYIAAARAKGLGQVYVLMRHALRPSSFSLLTIAGISLGRLLGGTVIVEVFFGLPGIGQLMFQSIMSRDLIMVQGVVALIAVGYVVVNMLVDAAYGLLDPRVRTESAR